MASVSFFKISYSSIAFTLKHIFLLTILNVLAYHCFNGYLVKFISKNFYFYRNFLINSKNLIAIILSIIIVSIKSIIYSTAINYEESGINVDFFDYIGEICDRFINVFVTVVVLLFIISISTLFFVLPGVFIYSILSYALLFCAGKTANSKNKNNFQENYNLNTSLYRSLEVSKRHRLKLFINNLIFMLVLIYLLYFTNYNFYIGTFFDSNYFIKFLIFDIFIIFTFKTGLYLDKFDDKEFETTKNQEGSTKFEISKVGTKLSRDAKIKDLGESYIKRKIR